MNCTYDAMNMTLISKKKSFMKYLKEKNLIEDKELLNKLSDIFSYSHDTGFKLGAEKMLKFFGDSIDTIKEQVEWFHQAKIYDGLVYFVDNNDSSKHAKVCFNVYNTNNLDEEIAYKLQIFEGYHPAAYGFYDFKLTHEGQFYSWSCDRHCRD